MNTPSPSTSGTAPIRVGLIGCGNVSRRYLDNIAGSTALTIVACADLVPAAAQLLQVERGIPAVDVDTLLASDDIDLVLNLTVPESHAELSMRALRAGKHVYTEKPLAAEVDDARALLAVADELGMLVGCAPDTVLGAGLTTCAALIADGAIGVPVSATALMMTPGPERFHPGPEMLFRHGAGPLFDGGPYDVSALVGLLGPVTRVGAVATTARVTRQILVGDRVGLSFPVETPTHVSSVLQFARGAVASLVTSFDVIETTAPRLEVHGTEGSLVAPAPNSWGGPVRIRRTGESEFSDVPVDTVHPGFMGMGLIDMAEAIVEGREPRASGARGLHVLEVLTGIRASVEDGRFCDIAPVDADAVISPLGRTQQ